MKPLVLAILCLLPSMVVAAPTTPTNTPRAHPLAPNPHTSVGLFWIYTDAATGRQWTGGTYKVKRCSGTSCIPTNVVATGLTTADYQDTGLTPNTVYGYCYLANDGSDSGNSPTVYVTTRSTNENMVSFPDATWEELLGPLPETSQIPFTWYNSTATTSAQLMIAKFPFVAPFTLQGTGSINQGSKTLTGSGTFFREQVAANNPSCTNHIAVNGVDAGTISSVNSNTSITLTSAWTGSNQANVTLTTNVSLCGFWDVHGDYLVGNQLYYYDSPMALWQLYYSTGDPQYMRGAIKASESVFAGFMRLGRNREVDNLPPPRNFQFSGYMLLGLAGHKGIWDWLDHYLTQRYPTWISNYRGGNHDFGCMREKAYMILFTAWFIAAAPDSFPRSDGTTTSLNGTITVDGDLTDGRKAYWRDQLDIDIPGFIEDDQTTMGLWMESSAYGDWAEGDFPYSPGLAQPFVLGLLGDALGYCWRNVDLSTTARNAARTQVLKLAAPLSLLTYNTTVAFDEPSVSSRAIYYFLGGGTRLNPYAFQHGSDINHLLNYGYNLIAWDRQQIPMMLSTFGWAYEMSGQPWYKTIGDEMANAAFAEIGENTGGTGDGKKSLCDSTGNFKNYGQCYRTSWRYFGNRLRSPSPLGSPPAVTMPANITLIGAVNQVLLTALVSCSNKPCVYKWALAEYPQVLTRHTAMPVFYPDDALTTKLCGLESGPYKIVFYTTDSLGLVGHGSVIVTAGDGQFPPVVHMGNNEIPPQHSLHISDTSVNGTVYAYSAAGRSLTHSFSVLAKPKDRANPIITPSGTTGNVIALTVSGLSNGYYEILDTVTDSFGLVRKAVWIIQKDDSPMVPPSAAHNTVPTVAAQPDHVLPIGSTSTRLYVAPTDPEGWVGFANPAPGYTQGYNVNLYMVTPLAHSWTQIGGPMSATITNGSTLRPDITNMLLPGTYSFRYDGIDPQGDTVTVTMKVVVVGSFVGRSVSGKATGRQWQSPVRYLSARNDL